MPTGVAPADAGDGGGTDFRTGPTALDRRDVVGARASTGLWPPGTGPRPPKARGGRGQPPEQLRRDPGPQPVAALDLAKRPPAAAWRAAARRAGRRAASASRPAAVRARPAHRDDQLPAPRPGEGLPIEWPAGEEEPATYRPAASPAAIGLEALVATAKARRRIARDSREPEQGAPRDAAVHGLGRDEGRGRRGSHHRASLRLAADGFPVAERRRCPPGRRLDARAPRTGLRRRLTAGSARRLPRCPRCLATPGPSGPLVAQ